MASHSSKSNQEHNRAKGTGSQWRDLRWGFPHIFQEHHNETGAKKEESWPL